MRLALDDETPIIGDMVIRAVQRFDLTPIPSTLELILRIDSTVEAQFVEGAVVRANGERYTLVKVRRGTTEFVQTDQGPAQVIEATGILSGLLALASPLPRAVVKDACTLGDVYRSCGSTMTVADDIPALRFACFVGDFPTAYIAATLQEEAAVAVLQPGPKLAFVRLQDLFKREPFDRLEVDPSAAVESNFLTQHQVPWAMSTSAAGAVVLGRKDRAGSPIYLPHTPSRVLDNMTRCLLVRRVMTTMYSPTARAGDTVDIGEVRHVIATAAHAWDNGSTGSAPSQTSRFWLAQLQG